MKQIAFGDFILSELTLGTAQLGMEYGINNVSGKLTKYEAIELLDKAVQLGITSFDTAQAYGISEDILSEFVSRKDNYNGLCIITKIHPILSEWSDVKNKLMQSMAKLKHCKIVLLHKFDHVNAVWYQDLIKTIQGFNKLFGISIYTAEEAEYALHHDEVDVIQVPFNLLDNKMLEIDFFKRALKFGKQVFVRSVFLQGLLQMPIEKLPKKLKVFQKPMEMLHLLCKKYQCTITRLAIDYVRFYAKNASIIIGVDNLIQLEEVAKIFQTEPMIFDDGDLRTIFQSYYDMEPKYLLNPSNW